MPSRQQLKQLQLALINAFPSKSLLERLLYFELEKNLHEITRDSDLQEIVFKLIQTAESQGWLIELVSAARQENPGNSKLAAIAVELLSPETPSAPKRSPSNSVTVVLPKQGQEVEGSFGITYEYDVFISHASEDKDDFVKPLAEKLRHKGHRVWYDEFSLRLGDSLRRSIDKGLANARYGIVVLSPNFFNKEWPQRELDGLAAREIKSTKVILPIWHEVTFDDVVRYFPTLADRLAVSTSRGMDYVVSKIVEVLQEQFSYTTAPNYEDITQRLYTQLQYFLEAKNWQEADKQTTQLMLNIAKREKEGYLDYDSINTFSCPDLKRIDQLWVSNSNKRFGFSVQKEIWIQTGNRLGIRPEQWNDIDFENYERFSRAVGWYDDLVIVNETGSSGGFVSYDELLSRIKTNPFKSPRGSLPKNLAFDYKVSNQGVLFSNCDL